VVTVFPGGPGNTNANNGNNGDTQSSFNGTTSGGFNGASAFQTLALTNTPNTFVIGTITGSSDGANFQLKPFDVTPTPGLTGVEQDVINMIVSVPSLTPTSFSASTSPVQVPNLAIFTTLSSEKNDGYDSEECSTLWTLTPQSSATRFAVGTTNLPTGFPFPIQDSSSDAPIISGSVILAQSQSSNFICTNPTPATFGGSPISIGTSSTLCGRQVTLLIGRPYQLTVPVQENSNSGTPSCQINTTSTFIGGISFVGNQFFQSPPSDDNVIVVSTFIRSCLCSLSQSPTPGCVPYSVPSCINTAGDAVASVVLGANGVAKETTVIKNGVGYLGKLLRAVDKKVKKL